ncbi:substrate-binding domain-containing protein [Coralloluteibacterium stylophorae]|uniref:Helix-turn-helix transcriptional regulator n=1 Tax=Coralloluteibacterium stylophorae TaxID=1776034 RepID=A0A8J7VUF8_9GAMM|nr:substrate-binding domain-containing protein [Coralloluteibacterium stylophorae]MBS7456232.1 helix-turn-helix transcriptional regulator [Coralloluteibacterium stylophorae]
MYRVNIRQEWTLQLADGRSLPPRLIDLLHGIQEAGTLAAACQRVGLSYRYGWGLLQDAERLLGAPLVRMTRGRGASLTMLGERLAWADRRIGARLSPTFESLATEVEVELERALSASSAALRIHANHGFAVEALRRFLSTSEIPVDLRYRSSDEVLVALRSGSCDLAGLHVPIGELEREVLAHHAPRIDPARDRVVHLVTRRQGLILPAGNPRGVRALADLLRPELRMVHRQPGSGTRFLFERLLLRHGIDIARIRGCDTEELTHAAVAAYVASGMADVGFGLETPARRFGLTFVPVVSERYFFLCDRDLVDSPRFAGTLAILRSEPFRRTVGELPGYDAGLCGTVETLDAAFASARAVAGPRR